MSMSHRAKPAAPSTQSKDGRSEEPQVAQENESGRMGKTIKGELQATAQSESGNGMFSVDHKEEERRMRRKFYEYRQTELFCDGMVVSKGGKTFRVHRVLMASKSDFFRAAFSSPLAKNGSVVNLDFATHVVDSIVDFCYTGDCEITDDTVQDILMAANEIGIIEIVELCCRYLEDRVSISNLYGIFRFASFHGCDRLAKKVWKMLLFNFVDFLQESREFDEMTLDDLNLLLGDARLNVPSEYITFQAMSRWIGAKSNENRKIHSNRLWSSIRFDLMEPEYCRTHILNASFIDNVSSNNLWIAHSKLTNVNARQRILSSRIPYQIIFAFGGWCAGAPTECMETYNLRADKWIDISFNSVAKRAYHGLVAIDNVVYVVGGFDGTDHFSSVCCLYPETGSWNARASMDRQRCYVACVVVNKEIYAIGGFDGIDRMDSVERYSIADNQWSFCPRMHQRRSDCGAVAVGTNIFVAGGYTGRDVLNSAELYNTDTKMWEILPNMNTSRSGVSLVFFNGYIYALGGFNGYERLNTVERLNVNDPYAWRSDVPSMISRRSNFCSVVLENKIFVFGGFDGSITIRKCECFDGERWYEISDMNKRRSALSACVCEGLDNAARYCLS